jgi:hypothetical protein
MTKNQYKIITFCREETSPPLAIENEVLATDAEYNNKDHLDFAIEDVTTDGFDDHASAIEKNALPKWVTIQKSEIDRTPSGIAFNSRYWRHFAHEANEGFQSPPLQNENTLQYELIIKHQISKFEYTTLKLENSDGKTFLLKVPTRWALSLLCIDPATIFKKNEHHR